MLAREGSAKSVEVAFSKTERQVLDKKVTRIKPRANDSETMLYLKKLACLGGYLARNSDPPPGFIFMTRGLNRLHALCDGVDLA